MKLLKKWKENFTESASLLIPNLSSEFPSILYVSEAQNNHSFLIPFPTTTEKPLFESFTLEKNDTRWSLIKRYY